MDAGLRDEDGRRVLASAHNGNVSHGRMFPIIESFNAIATFWVAERIAQL